MTFLRR